jgi:hypothetical protein
MRSKATRNTMKQNEISSKQNKIWHSWPAPAAFPLSRCRRVRRDGGVAARGRGRQPALY